MVRSLLACLFLLTVGSAPTQTRAPTVAAISGKLIPADGASPAGLRVFLRSESLSDSVEVDSAGGFTLPLPVQIPDETFELLVDAADRSMRRHLPALVRMRREELAGEHRFVLVPRQWTIPAGTYAGQTVEISLVQAFAPSCSDCSGFYLRGGNSRATGRPNLTQGWAESAFPLRVAFDRERSGDRITARDSAAFWSTVGTLEERLGSDLFRPVPYDETIPGEDEPEPEDVVLIWIDPGLRFSGLGIAVSEGSKIIYGAVRIRRAALITDAQGSELVGHEMMHALGVGHTCSWRSLVADPHTCFFLRSSSATPADVAYWQLARRVRDLQQVQDARWGIEAALAGEQSMILGHPSGEP